METSMSYWHILQAFVFFSLTGKKVPPKNVTSTSKKRAAQNFGRSGRKGKANPATVTLANYFKMKAKSDHLQFGGLSPSEKPDGKKTGSPSPGSDQTVPQNRKIATSLILFEEVNHLATPHCKTYNLMDMRPHITHVWSGFGLGWSSRNCLLPQVDVIFDDDVGFLAAIKTVMTTTKRPVILTTNGKRTHCVIWNRIDLRTSCDAKFKKKCLP